MPPHVVVPDGSALPAHHLLLELVHGEISRLEPAEPAREVEVGDEDVLRVADDVDVLAALGDLLPPQVTLEDPRTPHLVGVEVLPAHLGVLVPRAHLRDLAEAHVAPAEHVADLGHPRGPALGVRHDEHVRGARLEVASILGAGLPLLAFGKRALVQQSPSKLVFPAFLGQTLISVVNCQGPHQPSCAQQRSLCDREFVSHSSPLND